MNSPTRSAWHILARERFPGIAGLCRAPVIAEALMQVCFEARSVQSALRSRRRIGESEWLFTRTFSMKLSRLGVSVTLSPIPVKLSTAFIAGVYFSAMISTRDCVLANASFA